MQIVDLQSNVTQIMGLSSAMGMVHMALAFGINTYLMLKRKQAAIAYAEGLAWILIFLGIALALAGSFIGISGLVTFGSLLAGLSFVGIFIAYLVNADSVAGLGNGLMALLNGVSYFGDVISYSRLMARGLSGVSIGAAFNLIVGQLPLVARFTV